MILSKTTIYIRIITIRRNVYDFFRTYAKFIKDESAFSLLKKFDILLVRVSKLIAIKDTCCVIK